MEKSFEVNIPWGVKVFQNNKEKVRLFDSYQRKRFQIKCQEVFQIKQSGRKICIVEKISSTNLSKVFKYNANQSQNNVENTEIDENQLTLSMVPILFFKGYHLRQGDIIKLKNIELVVKQIHIRTVEGNKKKSSQVYYNQQLFAQPKLDEDEQYPCRICLNTSDYKKNHKVTLVNPCSCLGTIARMHIKCLKKWINIKSLNSNQMHSPMLCDICQKPLKLNYEVGESIIRVKPINLPKCGNLLILEGVFQGTLNQITVIANQGDTITLGKSKQCQVVIKDPQLANNHAIIKLQNGQFYIYDKHTKCQAFKCYKNSTINNPCFQSALSINNSSQ